MGLYIATEIGVSPFFNSSTGLGAEASESLLLVFVIVSIADSLNGIITAPVSTVITVTIRNQVRFSKRCEGDTNTVSMREKRVTPK